MISVLLTLFDKNVQRGFREQELSPQLNGSDLSLLAEFPKVLPGASQELNRFRNIQQIIVLAAASFVHNFINGIAYQIGQLMRCQ